MAPPKAPITQPIHHHSQNGGGDQGNAGGAQLSSGMTTGQHAAFRN